MILSTFSGLGMLDEAFRRQGHCVVSAGDVTWGGLYDIAHFHPPADVFEGVIGGPPCQSFSALAALVRANGHEPKFGNLIPEFERVVAEAQPAWFLMENVPKAPKPCVPGYVVFSQKLNNRWTAESPDQNRERVFSFGSLAGVNPWPYLEVACLESPLKYSAVKGDPRPTRQEARTVTSAMKPFGRNGDSGGAYRKRMSGSVTAAHGYKRDADFAVTARHAGKLPYQQEAINTGKAKMSRYGLEDACELQGLPRDFFQYSPYTKQGALQLVANGVPLMLGVQVALAITTAINAKAPLAE